MDRLATTTVRAPRDTHPPASPLTLLHGFTQTRACWGSFAQLIDPTRARTFVDLPGHGGSATVEVADLWQTADRIAEVIAPGIVVGYSMGGRAALHLALRYPDRVHALIVIGADPGIPETSERAERQERDRQLADRIQADLPAFVDDWLSLPLFRSLPVACRFRAERIDQDPSALARSLQTCGTGTQTSLWSRLAELEMPVLSVVGESDEKFVDLGQRFTDAVPDGTLCIIPACGHAAHLERPREVAEAINAWMASHRSSSGRPHG